MYNNMQFASMGPLFVILNIISTKLTGFIDTLVNSLYRLFLIEYKIKNDNDSNGALVDSMISYIFKNRMKLQTPLYEILDDKTDIEKKNKFPGKKKDLNVGSYLFWHNGKPFFAKISVDGNEMINQLTILASKGDTRKKTIMLIGLRCFNDSMTNLIKFCCMDSANVKKAKSNHMESLFWGSTEDMVKQLPEKEVTENIIYLKILNSHGSHHSVTDKWIEFSEIQKRKMETVILDEKIKSMIMNDYEKYSNETTRKIFETNGIHYKRSYLLHGKPGGGKTSFIRAFASHYNMDIYELNNIVLTDLNILRIKLHQIPKNSIVILEDIDVLFPNREQLLKELEETKNNVNNLNNGRMQDIKSNMSKFFNLFDGIVNTMDGCIIFFTTNYIDRLDPAVLRPGRSDLKIEFPHLNDKNAFNLVQQFYQHIDEKYIDDLEVFNRKEVMPCELSEYLKENVDVSETDIIPMIVKYFK